ncbi:hypothetical protein ACFV80_42460 [Streptomyces sp. NPDC059862]|uniref:hypothetical protein n=1 Tax=Streptomyces sp. NPDC059862 TaxID=3346975 RepID=UPI003650C127
MDVIPEEEPAKDFVLAHHYFRSVPGGEGAVRRDPGVVCADDGPEFIALQEQVRAALRKTPRKDPELARRGGRALCDGCTAHCRRHFAGRAGTARPRPGLRPLQWMKEMTMDTNPTALLLDLAARAQNVSDRDTLHDLLATGHRAWCEGVADVRTDIGRETAGLSDAQLAERCAAAGAPWEEGMTRSEAVSALAFATWEAAPAAMAYTELEERAAHFGVCLLGEELL